MRGMNVGLSVSAFITKILCIQLILFKLSNLVICVDQDDDSLQNALEFVERRQRDLQLRENDYYGQPEDIGYGYQKNFGIFENGPAKELGIPDTDPENENDFRNLLYNYMHYQRDNEYDGAANKRKSNFRERNSNAGALVSEKERESNPNSGSDVNCSYMQLLKDLWAKYRRSHPDDVGIEDLSSDQVFEILNSLYEKDAGRDGEEFDPYENSNDNEINPYGTIPLRSRRNYRVFDNLNERKKRYPSFGEGFYGKRSSHSQHINYENPNENEFLYALKFVNPEMNREAVENLKDGGYEVLGDEKDRDVLRILNDAVNGPRASREDDTYWSRKEDPYENEIWFPGPVVYPSDDTYQDIYDANEKRAEPRIFKPHNGIHLNRKRMPVKRSPVRSKKQAADEKISKELKEIFEHKQQTTTQPPSSPPPKKEATKKPTEVIKKQNVTKPIVTKHRDVKKLVRRANDYTKEQVYPSSDNSEIEKIFNEKKVVDKKSIDWSQYFGFDKRSDKWLKLDSIRRAEGHFLDPASKEYLRHERDNVGNVNFLDRYEVPFDTRVFNNKNKYSYNVDQNIDRLERKLANIEERIIDDAVKYTGAHTGGPNEDLRKVKDEIVHHLEAAYSFEKMKNALEEFKNSVKSEKTFSGMEEPKKSGTESPKPDISTTTARIETTKMEKPEVDKRERVSTKKEIEDVYGKDNLEFLNWPSRNGNGFANNQYDNIEECPVLDKSLNNCRRVGEITGKYAELLFPICSLHQICYLCGSEMGFSRPSACDIMYLTEAENLCQTNKACLLTAGDSIVALRNLHEQDLISGSSQLRNKCLFSPCIQKYFLNTPAAMIPLDYQD